MVKEISKEDAMHFMKAHYPEGVSETYIAQCRWLTNKSETVMCGVEFYNEELVVVKQFVVSKEFRGQGYGQLFGLELKGFLQRSGVKKVIAHVFANNLPSVFMCLKMGGLIEGLMRNQLSSKEHENVYVIGGQI